ncbi:MAG TPA: hypothetical protein VK541_08420 [Pedobacter sp.]|uniref:hypothetical protein n=1 Tax=Pedobacter sp. TaxID=1411316 RepID=UPI002C04FC55|nr:hypothetical protein [Pedobacter sp.]HMI02490.1 hypothetical protein [Pedobacter sp.]
MQQTKRYEILESLPSYGPMYIPVSENNEAYYSEGYVARFYTSEDTTWVGNFEPGLTGLDAVYEFEDDPYILVIAGGTCYLMNPDFHKPISIFGALYETAIKTLDGRLILQDSTHLTVFEISGEHWSTERISWDGIKELIIEGNLVRGVAYRPTAESDEWVEFVVDLEKRNVRGGSWCHHEFKPTVEKANLMHKHQPAKRRWWKIW